MIYRSFHPSPRAGFINDIFYSLSSEQKFTEGKKIIS